MHSTTPCCTAAPLLRRTAPCRCTAAPPARRHVPLQLRHSGVQHHAVALLLCPPAGMFHYISVAGVQHRICCAVDQPSARMLYWSSTVRQNLRGHATVRRCVEASPPTRSTSASATPNRMATPVAVEHRCWQARAQSPVLPLDPACSNGRDHSPWIAARRAPRTGQIERAMLEAVAHSTIS